MRTYIAEVALDTGFGIPARNVNGDAALFISGKTLRESAVGVILKCGNGKIVALLSVDGFENVGYEVVKHRIVRFLNIIFASAAIVFGVCPGSRNIDLDKGGCAAVDSFMVHADDIFAFAAKFRRCGILHVFNRVFSGNDVGELEEAGLEGE